MQKLTLILIWLLFLVQDSSQLLRKPSSHLSDKNESLLKMSTNRETSSCHSLSDSNTVIHKKVLGYS